MKTKTASSEIPSIGLNAIQKAKLCEVADEALQLHMRILKEYDTKDRTEDPNTKWSRFTLWKAKMYHSLEDI